MKLNLYILILMIVLSGCQDVFIDDMEGQTATLLAPQDSTETLTLTQTFLWEAVDDADSYRLQIASPSFENMQERLLDSAITTTSYQYTFDYGTYEWRVRPENSASVGEYVTRTITILDDSLQDLTQQIMVLDYPDNNLATSAMDIIFIWDSVPYADDYRFELATPDFNGTVLLSGELTTSNTYTYSFTDEGVYQWRVRAQNETTNTSYTTYTFEIDTTAPDLPVLVSPADSSSQSDSTITFTWTQTATGGTSMYDSLFIYNDAVFTTSAIVKAVKTETTSYETSLYRDSTYYWEVRSYDVAGNSSDYSVPFMFTITP